MLKWLFARKHKRPSGPEPERTPHAAAAAAPASRPEAPTPLPLEPAPLPPAEDAHSRTADDVLRMLATGDETPPPGEAVEEPVDPNLGRHLLAEGPVTREFLHQQLAVSGKADSYLGHLLATVHAPGEARLVRLLAVDYRVPDVDLKQCKIPIAVARLVPLEILTKYKMIPIDRIGDLLCVAFAGEVNPKATEAVRRATGLRVKALRCPPHHIEILLRRLMHEPAAAKPAVQAVRALPISDAEYEEAARGPEDRWEAVHASRGPLRAVRIA
ncbi:MAG TPA: hypothetical protein VNE39_09860 [Planctomycetota bacterium]|nr:hypothetical protein [Planctomycetota bacterium]